LLTPNHASESLALDETSVRVFEIPLQFAIVRVGFCSPGIHHFPSKDSNGFPSEAARETSSDFDEAAGWNTADDMSGSLRSILGGVHGCRISMDDVFMECVLKAVSACWS
jgi:hypothetical protein